MLISGCGVKLRQSGAANLQINPGSLDFGNVTVSQSSAQAITFSNSSSNAVQLTQVSISGSGFSLSGLPAFPLSLAAGKSVSVQINFAPSVTGAATGSVDVSSYGIGKNVQTIALRGNGQPSSQSQSSGVLSALTCSSSSITGSASDSCSVTLSAAAGSGGVSIALSSSSSKVTVPATLTIPSGASSANFTAQVAGVTSPQTETLTATANSVTKTFNLTLYAAAPTLAISSTSLNFGSVTAGSSATKSVTVTSNGTSALTLSAASITGTGFTVSGASLPVSLNPGSSVTFQVQFSPASSGSFSGTLNLSTNVPGSTSIAVSLAGIGQAAATQPTQPALSVSASSLDFGSVTVGSSAIQTLTVTSNGTSALTISSAGVTGTGFSISGASFPANLNPGSSVTLQLQFSPASAASFAGTLNLSTNVPGSSTVAVPLTGTGQATTTQPLTYQVLLTWSAPASSTDPVAGYNIYRETGGSSSYTKLNASPNSSITYTDASVASGTTYNYYVKSVDASGNESSASNTFTAAIP